MGKKRNKIEALIRALLDDDEEAYGQLVRALRKGGPDRIAEFASHDASRMREAVAEAAAGTKASPATEVLLQLADDRESKVRRSLARALAEGTAWTVDAAVLTRLTEDDDDVVREHGATAMADRAEFLTQLAELLENDYEWRVRRAVVRSLATLPADRVRRPLLFRLAHDDDRDVCRETAKALEAGMASGSPREKGLPPNRVLGKAHDRVKNLGTKRFPRLAKWLGKKVSGALDLAQLGSFGTDLTAAAQSGKLTRAHGVDAICEELTNLLSAEGSRSAVLIGPTGSGKTAVVHELVHLLQEDWRVIRVTASELMAGTKYLGEWETKVRNLVEATRRPRKVILYVPNLQELRDAGQTSKSNMNIATMLAPYIESGDIVLLGESTPERYRTGVGSDPSLRRLFEEIQIPAATEQETRDLAELVGAENGVEIPKETLDALLELGSLYLQDTAHPGRALRLLRRSLDQQPGDRLEPKDVLESIGSTTGIPIDLLDDRLPLDLAATRRQLESRVMGQPEAVDAVLDLVTLVKAGLCDPDKPFGVFLFVGPTGVGKTELAKALAELLFGDPARIHRLDMSEYATYASYERLIGTACEPGLLTSAIRERPFSVLLLDEIEKGHQNVFDLCLQIFDAGRLTDGAGRTVDFRHTIVILTSNVGSKTTDEKRLGFADEAPAPPDREMIDRDLHRFFRPEFLNRIDRVVHFDPLTPETAEKIARRELARVLKRSGIERRDITVDIDPAVLALLLREGYSHVFGARPLKRTVERRVLLPLARAIATGAIKSGGVLRLVEKGGRIEAEPVSNPNAEERPDRTTTALAEVVRRATALEQALTPLAEEKERLLARSRESEFWARPERARTELDRIHRLDNILGDYARLREQLEITARNPNPKRAAEFTEWHDFEERRLRMLAREGDLDDAVVVVSRVRADGAGLDAVTALARMYREFAHRRRFDVEVLDDRRCGDPNEDTVAFAIGGAGAYALLRTETGLHQVRRKIQGDKSHDERRRRELRDLVRVEVMRQPDSEGPAHSAQSGQIRLSVQDRPVQDRHGAEARFGAAARFETSALHLPTMISVKTWQPGDRDQAKRRTMALLHARLAAKGATTESTEVVRTYSLGPNPRVIDRRSGTSTGRIDRILKGELESFLIPADR